MWKAFDEMEELGWIGSERPKMISVQAAGCFPIKKAWNEHAPVSTVWENAHTIASGLRVPKAYGDYIILEILKASCGTAVVATNDEMLQAVSEWASTAGIFAAPEGAASLVAYQKLLASEYFKPGNRVVLFNTGSGLKYIDVMANYKSTTLEKQLV